MIKNNQVLLFPEEFGNKEIKKAVKTFDLESLYKKYPRKEGKKIGIERLSKQIKNEKDYELLSLAIDNYTKLCVKEKRIEKGFVKMFSTFASCWQDYIDVDFGKGSSNKSLAERIMKGEL